jgi:hypothetical protein
MDGERFDHLTRWLAGSLPRRRLLRSAAGTLIGVVLARRAGVVRAQQTCTDCADRGLECCTYDLGVLCRTATQTCCGPILCSEGYACVDGFCVACPPEKKCGSRCCNDGQTCENEECVVACPTGTTRCGTSNCCDEGQDCSDGGCVDACPVGVTTQRAGRRRSRRREVAAEASCESCPVGTVKCQGTCVPACRGKRSLDGSTCRCTKKRCADDKTKCDGECVNTTIDPNHCGGCAGNGGVTCVDGKCCGGECSAPGLACCGFNVCGVDETCCGQDATQCCPNERCCGDTCCPKDTYCANSRRGLCCRAGEQYCRVACCPIGTVCASFEDSICCPPTDPVYCPKKHRCVKSRAEC